MISSFPCCYCSSYCFSCLFVVVDHIDCLTMAKFFALVSFSSLLLLLFPPPLLFLMLGQPEYGTDQKSTRANQFFVICLFCCCYVFGFVFTRPGFFFCCCSSLCCKANPSGIWSRPKKHQDYSQFLTETVMRPFLALPNSSLSFLPFCHFNFLAF